MLAVSTGGLTMRIRSNAAAVVVGLTTTLALTLPTQLASATAGDGQGARESVLITEFQTQTLSATLVLDPRSKRISITDLTELTGLVDRAGELLGEVTSRPLSLRASAGGVPLSTGSCVNNSTDKHFRAYETLRISTVDGKGAQHYVVSPYQRDRARKIQGSGRSTQFELCSTGGADLQDGWRVYQAGVGMTILDPEAFKIDQAWRSGDTPADYDLSLDFQLGKEDGPLSITGSISQEARDKLKGSFLGPYETFMDGYSHNSVNAWWEDGCMSGWSRCQARADGSSDFQGTVAHGLWEFTKDDLKRPLRWHATPYLRYTCKGLFGC